MNQVTRIGIVGGGQLARMMTEAAMDLGLSVTVLDPIDNCPASQVGARQIVGAMDDPQGMAELAEASDVITIDIEHVNAEALEQIAEGGFDVFPLPKTISLIQDKYNQKVYLRENGVSVADFVQLEDPHAATEVLERFGGKMILKTRRGAYDGRGNYVVNSSEELEKALAIFKGQSLYAEAFVPFVKELAVMIARDMQGNITTYPIVETIQNRNICEYVLAPAGITEDQRAEAEQLAIQVASHLRGPGIFGIEMFLTNEDQVLVNEVAPRVHNSGHYTIEACATSQFEQHIRAISGLPLGSSELKVPAAVMVNILGKRDGPVQEETIDKISKNPHTYVHLYGKSPTKIDRKMGHVTITANMIDEAFNQAKLIEQTVNI